MAELRCYFEVEAHATLTETQWLNVIAEWFNADMLPEIQALGVAHNLPHLMVNINRVSVTGQFMIGDFELVNGDVSTVNASVNANLTAHGQQANNGQLNRFARLLRFELREAVDVFFTTGQANQTKLEIIGFGERTVAMAEAQAYIATNSARYNGAI